jgi:enoyl-CoA hydratase/carnithine racemase
MKIDYEKDGHVGIISIDHGRLNTLTPAMHRQLHGVLLEFLSDPEVHCGVMRGAGDRSFCAGDDLKVDLPEVGTEEEQLREELSPAHLLPGAGDSWNWAREFMMMERLKPIVGALRGWCLGGGFMTMLRLTDIRIAGKDAKFGLPEIAYGMAGAGGSLQLSRHIPKTAAMQMVLTGDPIDAEEARRIFLVNEVVEDDQVFVRAMAIARRIAEHPPLAVNVEMEANQMTEHLTPREALRTGGRLYQLQRLANPENELESFEKARAQKSAK